MKISLISQPLCIIIASLLIALAIYFKPEPQSKYIYLTTGEADRSRIFAVETSTGAVFEWDEIYGEVGWVLYKSPLLGNTSYILHNDMISPPQIEE